MGEGPGISLLFSERFGAGKGQVLLLVSADLEVEGRESAAGVAAPSEAAGRLGGVTQKSKLFVSDQDSLLLNCTERF